jgi:hypothetical protein
MPFWTNIVLLKPNLKSKFIKFFFCEKQGFSGPPRKKLAAPIYAYPLPSTGLETRAEEDNVLFPTYRIELKM